MRKLVTSVAAAAVLLVPQLNLIAQSDEALAIMIPGGGTYSRPITTDSAEAQAFFDQGLRMAWSFYFCNVTISIIAKMNVAICI